MLRYFFRLHILAILAVLSSLFGSLLMFLIGGWEIVESFLLFLGFGHPAVPGKEIIEAVPIGQICTYQSASWRSRWQ